MQAGGGRLNSSQASVSQGGETKKVLVECEDSARQLNVSNIPIKRKQLFPLQSSILESTKMLYEVLKIEEAISLKMGMYGGFHGPVAI